MSGLSRWFSRSVDKKQLTTIVLASVVLGGAVFVVKKAGFNQVATVVKGG